MKKPASFHTATAIMQPSTVRGSPSQLCDATPASPSSWSTRP